MACLSMYSKICFLRVCQRHTLILLKIAKLNFIVVSSCSMTTNLF
jgi:hypothetical protein